MTTLTDDALAAARDVAAAAPTIPADSSLHRALRDLLLPATTLADHASAA